MKKCHSKQDSAAFASIASDTYHNVDHHGLLYPINYGYPVLEPHSN